MGAGWALYRKVQDYLAKPKSGLLSAALSVEMIRGFSSRRCSKVAGSGNLSLFKEFVIQRIKVQPGRVPRRELQYLNPTQFGGPGQNGGISANLGSSNFGAITSAWNPRVFQLGLKVIY